MPLCQFQPVAPSTPLGTIQTWVCPQCQVKLRASHPPQNRDCGPVGRPRTEARSTPTSNPTRGTCSHQGDLVREQTCKPCQSSTGRKSVEVFQCAVHGECTKHNTSIQPRVRACATCPDFIPLELNPTAIQLNREKNVVLIWPWLGLGGAERWMVSMCTNLPLVSRELGEDRYRVTAVVITVPDSVDPEMLEELSRWTRVVIHRNGPNPNPEVDSLVSDADLVIIGGTTETSHLLRAAARKPVVFIAHGACSTTTAAAQAAADGGIVTHYTAVSHMSAGIFPPELQPKVTVIPNGAEVARCTPFIHRAKLRHDWGVKPGQKVIGYIGRFSPDKRWEALPSAIAELSAEYVGVMIGHDPNGAAERVCEELAPSRILFPGRVNVVGSALAAFDRWFNASPAEGCCLSRLEAAIAGCAVISTPTGDLPLLESQFGPQAWTFPVGAKPKEIAQVIEASFDDPEETERRADRARRLSWNDYTATAMAARWIQYFESILKV